MTYRIHVHPIAVLDIENAHASLAQWSEEAADRLLDLFDKSIDSLRDFPRRCPIAPESRYHPEEVRQMLVGNYRMLFYIYQDTVHILRIRHTSQKPFKPGELN